MGRVGRFVRSICAATLVSFVCLPKPEGRNCLRASSSSMVMLSSSMMAGEVQFRYDVTFAGPSPLANVGLT